MLSYEQTLALVKRDAEQQSLRLPHRFRTDYIQSKLDAVPVDDTQRYQWWRTEECIRKVERYNDAELAKAEKETRRCEQRLKQIEADERARVEKALKPYQDRVCVVIASSRR